MAEDGQGGGEVELLTDAGEVGLDNSTGQEGKSAIVEGKVKATGPTPRVPIPLSFLVQEGPRQFEFAGSLLQAAGAGTQGTGVCGVGGCSGVQPCRGHWSSHNLWGVGRPGRL